MENSLGIVGAIWNRTSYKLVDKYLIVSILNNGLHFVFTETDFKENDYKTLITFLEQYLRKKSKYNKNSGIAFCFECRSSFIIFKS